eukprot:11169788-Lingulodinium_polyedra.AAC.1
MVETRPHKGLDHDNPEVQKLPWHTRTQFKHITEYGRRMRCDYIDCVRDVPIAIIMIAIATALM